MKRNDTALLIIILLSLSFLYLGFSVLKSNEKECPPLSECGECACEENVKETTQVISAVGADNPVFIYGTLKKEEIPQELELGEYWYWLYFEEPLLLVNNASGVPMYVDKIQVLPPQSAEIYDVEQFLDKEVELYGYQTWGYAESSVFQINAIREY